MIVLCVSLLSDESDRVHIADGSGKNMKTYKLSNIIMDDEIRLALVGFHAFTGNDYASSLFGVGKKRAFSLMVSDERHVGLFQQIGEDIDDLHLEEQLEWAEHFVCQLYSEKKCTSVNDARYTLFKKQLVRNKTTNLSRIPPCQSVLRLHLQRASYIAHLWKNSQIPQINLPAIDESGWFSDGDIVWTEEELFPETLSKHVVADEERNDEEEEEEDMYDFEDDDSYFSEMESDDNDDEM